MLILCVLANLVAVAALLFGPLVNCRPKALAEVQPQSAEQL